MLACNDVYTPKPRGYFRIEFPKKEYIEFNNGAPYTFLMPKYSVMIPDSSEQNEEFWYNMIFPQMNATLHLTYKKVENNISEYVEDTRELVNKHTVKADAIEPEIFNIDSSNVIGVLFEIKGDAATPYQFFVTDSVNHFLRGSFYFNVYPNKDSLAPANKFIKGDIIKIIKTIRWNE